MSSKIIRVRGREILDSRGNPTVEVEITLESGLSARAGVPSGASTGTHEALELRDGDKARYGGKGVLAAVANVNKKIGPAVDGIDAADQAAVDQAMIKLDGTENKSVLGANAMLGVSMAAARAAAQYKSEPLYRHLGGSGATILPVPMFNILNGGVHSNWQATDFQEFMIAPVGAPNFREALRWGSEVYQALKSHPQDRRAYDGRRGRRRFRPRPQAERARRGIHPPGDRKGRLYPRQGHRPGPRSGLVELLRRRAVQPALGKPENHFGRDGRALRGLGLAVPHLGHRGRSGRGRLERLEDSSTKRSATRRSSSGDDLFVTNVKRIRRGIEEDAANAVLIKLNQIGTVTETIEAIRMAGKAGWGAMVSHRSGETVDSFIADFTVAMGTGHLKTGAPCRGERVEKYNQLMRIEEELGTRAVYAGRKAFVR